MKWTRLWKVIDAARATYYGIKEHTGCYHDCGPHGSCRCSVCVAGGNTNQCMPPKCPECNSDIYYHYLLAKVFLISFLVQLLLSIMNLVLLFKSKYQKQLERTGCTCCLCSRQLCTHNCTFLSGNTRLRCSLRVWRRWIFFGLPPVVHFIFSIICLSVLGALCKRWFEEPMKVVDAVLKEELNPSDHLMVTSVLETM